MYGVYDATTGYRWLLEKHRNFDSQNAWNWIWRLPAIEKCHFLVCLICHDVIPTNVLRRARGLALSKTCQRCHAAPETSLHCLRDCNSAWRIWVSLFLALMLAFVLMIRVHAYIKL